MKTFFINLIIAISLVIGFIGCGQNDQNEQNDQNNTQKIVAENSLLENRTVDLFYQDENNVECDEISSLLGLCKTIISEKPISIYMDFSNIKSMYNKKIIKYIENKYSDSNLSLTKRTYYDETNQTKVDYYLDYGEDIYSNLYNYNKPSNDVESSITFQMKIYSIHLDTLNIDVETDENTYFSIFDGEYINTLNWIHDKTVTLKDIYINLNNLNNSTYKIITNKYSFDIELINGEIKVTNKKDIDYFAFDYVPLNQNTYYNDTLYTTYFGDKKTYFYDSKSYTGLIKNGKAINDYKIELNYHDKVIFPKENYIFITDDENEFKKYMKDNNLSNYYLNNYLKDNNITKQNYFSDIGYYKATFTCCFFYKILILIFKKFIISLKI